MYGVTIEEIKDEDSPHQISQCSKLLNSYKIDDTCSVGSHQQGEKPSGKAKSLVHDAQLTETQLILTQQLLGHAKPDILLL